MDPPSIFKNITILCVDGCYKKCIFSLFFPPVVAGLEQLRGSSCSNSVDVDHFGDWRKMAVVFR